MTLFFPLRQLRRISPALIFLICLCSWIGPEREWDNPHDDQNPDRPLPPVLTNLPKDTVFSINDEITFSISTTSDSGSLIRFEWTFGIGNSTSFNQPTYNTTVSYKWGINDTGTHDVEVYAVNKWNMPSDTHTFHVTVLSNPPSLLSTYADTTVSQESEIIRTFSAKDSNGIIEMYLWGTGDSGWTDSSAGPEIAEAKFKYENVGKLPVHWAARDDDSLMVSDTFTITFNRRPDTAYLVVSDDGTIDIENFDVINDTGSITLEYHANDPDGDSDTITYTFIVVSEENDTLIDYTGDSTSRSRSGISPSTTFRWYITAEDLFGDTVSAQGEFTTIPPPPPEAPEGMVLITSGGEFFHMGQSGFDPSEEPIHTVGFDYCFCMDTTEVTNAAYAEVMNRTIPTGPTARYPVSGISWFDAVLYCNARSAAEDRDTVYLYTGKSDSSLSDLTMNLTTNGYRLPSEAEWEYACKKDSLTLYYWGNDNFTAHSHAWFIDNSKGTVHQVAALLPNPSGIYDMAGNVWEWCNDWFDPEYYTDTPMLNPSGPSKGTSRCIRGGSYSTSLYFLQAGSRGRIPPSTRDTTIGFRTVIGFYNR